MATISKQDAFQYINNWMKFGKIDATNDYAFFTFKREELLSLIQKSNIIGIRFHLAETTGKASSDDICIIANGVSLNTNGGFDDVYDLLYINDSKSKVSNYDPSGVSGSIPSSGHNMPKGLAKDWVDEYKKTPYDKKCMTKNHGKLWAGCFANADLQGYITQTDYTYSLVHLATKKDGSAEDGATTFILSGSNNSMDDSYIINVAGTNNVLEISFICPPICGGGN